jgi:aspartate/methionine/tyrosine aminotransferase
MTLLEDKRAYARHAPESDIVAVANHDRGRTGLIPLRVGEGDLPTPTIITDVTNRALSAGETFYTWQRGIPDLRRGVLPCTASTAVQ